MKVIKLLLLLTLIAVSKHACAQDAVPDSVVIWQAGRPLQWADFMAPVDAGSAFQAETFTQVKYTFQWHKHNNVYDFTFKVHAYMSKLRS